jgi:hypothetical protein
MKKSVFTIVITMLIAGFMFISCQSSAKKVENAENNLQEARDGVAEAKLDLNKSEREYNTEYMEFRKASDEKIAAHEKSIAEFKTRIANEKLVNKVAYEKKLKELEQKNSDMKKKLDEYKEESQDKWASFKSEFGRDLDDLGKAFKDFTVKNNK